MKKYIFLISILTTFLNADSVLFGRCVKSYYIIDGPNLSNRFIFVNFSDNTTYKTSYTDQILTLLNDSFDKYTYNPDNNTCVIATSKYFGMTETQFNFISALTGLLTGFLLSFIILKRV